MERPPVLLYRLGRWFHRLGLPVLPGVLAWTGRLLFACFLPGSAKIGKRLTVGYWGLGVVVHKDTVIGDDCLIGQNVTIGRNFGDRRVPVLGDWVYVGAGSVVYGEITVGDGAVIGANSVVNRSVAPGQIVAGNPARPIGETGGKNYRELDAEKLSQRG